jgi:hypothetical protein
MCRAAPVSQRFAAPLHSGAAPGPLSSRRRVFFAHDRDGCRSCGCSAVRGGLFKPDVGNAGWLLRLFPQLRTQLGVTLTA